MFFIVFNCVEYVNNLELLILKLFGYVKGVFIGVDKVVSGFIEISNGGVLFIDEVYWLLFEGQEKLFYFMDNGSWCWLGESVDECSVMVWLIFVLIEDLEKYFLVIFICCILVIVKILLIVECG